MKNALITRTLPDPIRGVYNDVYPKNQESHVEIFCSKCRKKTILPIVGYGIKSVCAHCGQVFSDENECYACYGGYIQLVEISAKYNSKGNIQIVSRYKDVQTYSNPGGLGIHTTYFSNAKVVNVAKRIVYQLPAKDKKHLYFNGMSTHLAIATNSDITYNEINIVRKMLGYPEITNFQDLPRALALMYPEISEDILISFGKVSRNLRNTVKETFQVAITHKLTDKTEKISNKEIRNTIAKDIMAYPVLKSLADIGFKSPDNIIKVLKVSQDNREKYLNIIDTKFNHFVKWYIRDKKETIGTQCVIDIYKKIIDDPILVYDTLDMFNAYEKDLKKMSNKGNLKKIHDDFSHEIEKIRFANKTIEYSTKERKLEGEYNGYTFELAPDTDYLYDVGKDMGICVGSYGDDAYHKRFDIVIVKENGKNEACLQIYNPEKAPHMVQAKKSHNMIIRDPVISAMKRWAEITNVDLECDDWERSITNAPDSHNSGDWHVENPRFQQQPRQLQRNNIFDEDDLLF